MNKREKDTGYHQADADYWGFIVVIISTDSQECRDTEKAPQETGLHCSFIISLVAPSYRTQNRTVQTGDGNEGNYG